MASLGRLLQTMGLLSPVKNFNRLCHPTELLTSQLLHTILRAMDSLNELSRRSSAVSSVPQEIQLKSDSPKFSSRIVSLHTRRLVRLRQNFSWADAQGLDLIDCFPTCRNMFSRNKANKPCTTTIPNLSGILQLET